MDYFLVFVVGLFLGWHVEKPAWVTRLMEKIKGVKKDDTTPPAA
jgi:hypothetical protein